jgi:phage tail tape-measure protein
MNTNCQFVSKSMGFVLTGLLLVGCAGGPLTTREKGAGIGALGGAAAGGLIGAAVGRPGTGAAIGGGLGLGAGALVGDQLKKMKTTGRINRYRKISKRSNVNDTRSTD